MPNCTAAPDSDFEQLQAWTQGEQQELRDQPEGRSSFQTDLFVVARNELYRELSSRRRAADKQDPLEVSVV